MTDVKNILPNVIDLEKISDKILLVDDNDNLLSSLKRQFHKQFKIETANSGAKALECIETKGPYAVVVSDMQMPEMNGMELLSRVAELSNKTIRVMLTGNANMDVVIDGINKGNLYRFLTKPVSKELLLQVLLDSLEQYKMVAEREQLYSLVNKQNEQLKDLNHNLENKVQLRTSDLNTANETLKKQNIEVIMTFSKIIELRPGIEKEHAKYLAQKASEIGKKMGMNMIEAQDTLIAGLLLQIGKMSLPEKLLTRPFLSLTSSERQDYLNHAVNGQTLLSALSHLKKAAYYIRCQYERYNGSGTPNGLIGEAIPLASRILAVIRDYLFYTEGKMSKKKLLGYEIKDHLLKNRGKIYDPKVIDLFLKSISTDTVKQNLLIEVEWFELQPGMIISELLVNNSVFVKNKTVTKDLIDEIKQLRKESGDNIKVTVCSRHE